MYLVLVKTRSPGVLELAQYLGREFQTSVALNISECIDTEMLKYTVEAFRTRGISMCTTLEPTTA